MTDMTPTAERAEAKPAWTRCDRCKQRLWNDRIDIEVHRAVCPADMARTIRNLGKALEKMAARVEELEQRPVAHVVELEAGPSLDFEHEAPWPAPLEADETADPFALGTQAAPLSSPSSSSYFDDEDDEDDEDPAAIRASLR